MIHFDTETVTPATESTFMIADNLPWKKIRKIIKLGLKSGASVNVSWKKSGSCTIFMVPDVPKVVNMSVPENPIVNPPYTFSTTKSTTGNIKNEPINCENDNGISNVTTVSTDSVIRDTMVNGSM